MDTSLTYKPHTFAFWEREHLIQVSGRLGFLLSSKNQLKQVADSEEVQKTKEIQVDRPEIISPVFHLHSTNIEPKFEPGFYNSAPFPYPHTFIIVSEDTRWPTNQLVGQGKGKVKKIPNIFMLQDIEKQTIPCESTGCHPQT